MPRHPHQPIRPSRKDESGQTKRDEDRARVEHGGFLMRALGGSHTAQGRATRTAVGQRSSEIARNPNLASRRLSGTAARGVRGSSRKSGERGFPGAGLRSLRSGGDRPRECRFASRSRPAAAAESDQRPAAGQCRGSPCGWRPGGPCSRRRRIWAGGRGSRAAREPPPTRGSSMSRRVRTPTRRPAGSTMGKPWCRFPSAPTEIQRRALSTVCVEESVTTGLDAMSPTIDLLERIGHEFGRRADSAAGDLLRHNRVLVQQAGDKVTRRATRQQGQEPVGLERRLKGEDGRREKRPRGAGKQRGHSDQRRHAQVDPRVRQEPNRRRAQRLAAPPLRS